METVHSTKTKGYVTFQAGNGKITIWFGAGESYKSEAEAREAAEMLKQFFEAKAAGKAAVLVVESDKLTGDLQADYDAWRYKKPTLIDQMNAAQPNGDALKEFADCCKDDTVEKIAGVIWGKRANDMTVEQYTAFTIAHNATQIFAHGGYTSHAAAVDDAAEIWRLAQRIEL